jgi:hypothetical protein
MTNYKTIESKKLILGSITFKPTYQGGFICDEVEVCKYDFDAETKDNQKTVLSIILKQLDCEPTSTVINKIISDLKKYEYCIFQQVKKGLKTELLKTFSLKIEKTTSKQFQLI